jgi:two-component system LytT family response regulator
MSIRILIVDDERPARNKIRAHLRNRLEVEIVGEAQNGLEAVDAIRTQAPDLVFLDIQMPGMNGFEVLEAIGPEAMPTVIFVTAFDEFALRAFEVEAVDYLLKPFDQERFDRAFERCERRLKSRSGGHPQVAQLLERVLPGSPYLQRMVVREADRLFFVDVRDVLRLSSQENYVELHTANGRHLVRETLNRLEQRLDPEKFARVHRQDIVNIDSIQELQPWSHGDYMILLRDGTRLRLSRRYQQHFLERFH